MAGIDITRVSGRRPGGRLPQVCSRYSSTRGNPGVTGLRGPHRRDGGARRDPGAEPMPQPQPLPPEPFLDRSVNVGLSGGEKKRSGDDRQIPGTGTPHGGTRRARLGLDIDAVREVAGAVQECAGPDSRCSRDHALHAGPALVSRSIGCTSCSTDGSWRAGDRTLADRLDAEGYDGLRQEGRGFGRAAGNLPSGSEPARRLCGCRCDRAAGPNSLRCL